MEFGFDKCATITITKGRVSETEGMSLPNNNYIKGLKQEETYKYLGILQADDVKLIHVKKKTLREYSRRVRKTLKLKLNDDNIIKAINIWAVPVVRYAPGIIGWTQAELEDLDQRPVNSCQLIMLFILRVMWTNSIFLDKLAEEDYYNSGRQSRKKSEHLMMTLKTAQNTQ